MMRTALALALCALLIAPVAAAGPPDVVGTVMDAWEDRSHCFLILTQPYENPVDAALGIAKVAICLATS